MRPDIKKLFEESDIANLKRCNYYDLLGVDKNADPETFSRQVTKQYRELALLCHPDHYHNDAVQADVKTEIFKLINDACSTLLDERTKLRYDSACHDSAYDGEVHNPTRNAPAFFREQQSQDEMLPTETFHFFHSEVNDFSRGSGFRFMGSRLGLYEPANCYQPYNGRGKITALAIFPDGEKFILGTESGRFELCNKMGETIFHRQFPEKKAITDIAIHPNGLFAAVSFQGKDLLLLQIVTGEVIRHFEITSDSHPSKVVFNHDGSLLATQLDNHMVFIWNTDTEKLFFYEKFGYGFVSAKAITFSPNGKYIAYSSDDHAFAVSHIEAQRKVVNGSWGELITAIAFSHDSQFIAVCNQHSKNVSVMRPVPYVHTHKEPVEYAKHSNPIQAVEFTADNKKMITVSFKTEKNRPSEGVIRIDDLQTKKYQTVKILQTSPIATVKISNGHILIGFESGAIAHGAFLSAKKIKASAVDRDVQVSVAR